MMNNKKIRPFKLCVLQNFPYIEADFDALTNYELLCKVVEYLNAVIESQNEVVTDVAQLRIEFNNLKDFVDNYFDNLDVTDEINNKLDKMVEDGTFQELLRNFLVLTTKTVKVPSDYETIEDALYDNYYKNINSNKEIIILIESGHKLTKGVKLINGDYSHFRIKSEDDVVKLATNFVGYNPTDEEHPTTDGVANTLFTGINCVFPVLDCLIDMENHYGDGLALYLSTGYVNKDCGVLNAGRYGCYAKDSSRVFATGSNWSGSNSAGIRMQHTSIGTFNLSTLDGCCKTDSTLGSAYISKQCICQLRESFIKNNTTSYAVLARRSRIDLEATEITNCYGGIHAEGGAFISGSGTILDGIPTLDAVEAVNSIIVGCRVSNCAHKSFSVSRGGMILNAEKSSSEETSGNVNINDCRNVNAFNVFSNEGLIHTRNSRPAYVRSNTTNGYLVSYPQHAEMFIQFSANIDDLSANESRIIDLTSSIVIPEGYTIKYFDLNATGRVNTGGGGNSVSTSITNFTVPGKFMITNTGYGDASVRTIKALNIRAHIYLIPNN